MTTTFDITIQGSEELDRALRDPAVVDGPLRRFLERASQVVEADARKRAPVDTGRLRSSISRRIELGNRRAVVGSQLVYAAPVEFGRSPGKWPPLGALQPWARRHGFPAGKQGAFLVARAIFRKGIKARPYLIPALVENKTEIVDLTARMGEEIREEFRRRAG